MFDTYPITKSRTGASKTIKAFKSSVLVHHRLQNINTVTKQENFVKATSALVIKRISYFKAQIGFQLTSC